jgi:fucose permease
MKILTSAESQHRTSPKIIEFIVLHLVFGLTGVLHVVGGALLPALAVSASLRDNQSGLLFLCYFVGSAIGALLGARQQRDSVA